MKFVLILISFIIVAVNCEDDFVGGTSNIGLNDTSLNLFMNEAIAEINSTENSKYVVVKILQATKKIVSGELYTFRVALKKDAADVICEFKVWEQSWMLNGRDVEVKCDNENVYKLTQNPVNMRSKKQYCLSP